MTSVSLTLEKLQDRQYMYKRTIKTLSQINFCCGKAISITYSDIVCSVSYPACKAHAPYCIIICGLWLHHIFLPYKINSAILGEKSFVEHIMRV